MHESTHENSVDSFFQARLHADLLLWVIVGALIDQLKFSSRSTRIDESQQSFARRSKVTLDGGKKWENGHKEHG